MRKFKITVNGTEYEVTVEETTDKCDQLPDENENVVGVFKELNIFRCYSLKLHFFIKSASERFAKVIVIDRKYNF